jgi:hypothetical protein
VRLATARAADLRLRRSAVWLASEFEVDRATFKAAP